MHDTVQSAEEAGGKDAVNEKVNIHYYVFERAIQELLLFYENFTKNLIQRIRRGSGAGADIDTPRCENYLFRAEKPQNSEFCQLWWFHFVYIEKQKWLLRVLTFLTLPM